MRRRKASTGKKKDKRASAGYPKREKHNIPDEYDELLRQAELEKLGKKLDESGRPVPITPEALRAILSSAVREKWMHCNNKLHFLVSKQEWNFAEDSRVIKHWQCNHCKGYFKNTEINVDHINPAGVDVTKSWEDFERWAFNVLNAGGDEDLQILCIPCHEIKNVMDARGITDWEEGKKVKKVIDFLNKTATIQKETLNSFGFSGDQIKNAKEREKCYKQLLEEGKI